MPEYPKDFNFGGQVVTDPYEQLYSARFARDIIAKVTNDESYEFRPWTIINAWLLPKP